MLHQFTRNCLKEEQVSGETLCESFARMCVIRSKGEMYGNDEPEGER